jgi:protein translocase SEC61 complex gamma subunit
MIKKIIEKINDYKRVLSVAEKPTVEELKEIIRICGIGMIILGAIGLIFYIIFYFIGG